MKSPQAVLDHLNSPEPSEMKPLLEQIIHTARKGTQLAGHLHSAYRDACGKGETHQRER